MVKMPVAPTNPAKSGFLGEHGPQYEDYARCIHCGLCLNHCPTYRLWGLEADSPRGRIRQMALVDQGRLELGATFVKHIESCLDCRACETACPAGVEYGKLVEAARAQIEEHHARPMLSHLLRWLMYRGVLPHPGRIAAVARVLRFYQRSGLQKLVRATGVLKLLGQAERERLMPRVDGEFFYDKLGKTFAAEGWWRGKPRARVAFVAGCMAQVTFAKLNEATIRVLTANGVEVVAPAGQTCCGALAVHAGYRDVAQEMARKNVEAFLEEKCDAIVTNAAGCGSTLKEYAHLFSSGEAESARAGEFAGKVRDVTEFLAELGLVAEMRAVPLRVTYQDSCHMAHGQRIREAPRKLIRAVPGVELVEMARADDCCGSAGVYNVVHTDAAMGILKEKMGNVKATGAQAIVTANPGCMLQLRAGVEMAGGKQEVLHVVELVERGIAAAEVK